MILPVTVLFCCTAASDDGINEAFVTASFVDNKIYVPSMEYFTSVPLNRLSKVFSKEAFFKFTDTFRVTLTWLLYIKRKSVCFSFLRNTFFYSMFLLFSVTFTF